MEIRNCFHNFISLFLAVLGLGCRTGFLSVGTTLWVQSRASRLLGSVAPQRVGSSWTGDQAPVSRIGRRILYHLATREALEIFSTKHVRKHFMSKLVPHPWGWQGPAAPLHVSGEQPGEELTASVRKWRNWQLSPEGVSGGNKAVGPRPKRKKSRADSKVPQFLQRLVRWTDDRQGCLRERHEEAGRKERGSAHRQAAQPHLRPSRVREGVTGTFTRPGGEFR